jgi:hypothetical protein
MLVLCCFEDGVALQAVDLSEAVFEKVGITAKRKLGMAPSSVWGCPDS